MRTGSQSDEGGPLIAGRLLRQLRQRAGLSQEQLAERCGITDRTIRGLESGAIRNPQQATLHRLATALKLAEHRRPEFLTAWQEQTHRPSLEAMFAPRRLPESDAVEQLRRQLDLVREVMFSERMVVGRHRVITTLTVRRTFVVVSNTIDRWVYGDSFDPAVVEQPYPVVSRVENCRAARSWPFGHDARLFEISFDQDLHVGDTYTFGFELDHGTAHRRPDPQVAPEFESLTAIRTLGPSLIMEVQFHPERLPNAVWQVEKEALGGPATRVRGLTLSPFHVANLVLEHPKPGLHGIRWSWPDANG